MWIEQGKQPTKNAFNLEKRNYNRKIIREVKGLEGEIFYEEKDILLHIESFCRDLSTSNHVESTSDSFESFAENLEKPKLHDNERDKLEGEGSLKECKNVIRTFTKGKSPADDSRGSSTTVFFFTCWEKRVLTYALLDEQSNACFVKENLLGILDVSRTEVQLKLSTVLAEELIKIERIEGLFVHG